MTAFISQWGGLGNITASDGVEEDDLSLRHEAAPFIRALTPFIQWQVWPTFSASCSKRRNWKHWSSFSFLTCHIWWRCCLVEWSLSSRLATCRKDKFNNCWMEHADVWTPTTYSLCCWMLSLCKASFTALNHLWMLFCWSFQVSEIISFFFLINFIG